MSDSPTVTPKTVTFSNYKCFGSESPVDIDLTQNVSLIIGRNNSGKSSFIDILEAIYTEGISDKWGNINESTINLEGPLTEELVHDVLAAKNGVWTGNIPNSEKNIIAKVFFKIFKYEHKNSCMLTSIQQDEALNNYPIDLKDYLFKRYLEDRLGNFNQDTRFLRLDSERNIIPESVLDTEEWNIDSDGSGSTDLIRKIINESDQDETLIERKLLRELNLIMEGDANFESIRLQQIGLGSQAVWEIYLQEKGATRFALSQSGSGLKTILLVLLFLIIMPEKETNKYKHLIFAFEELENNLHPAIQRKLFNYLYEYAMNPDHDVQIYLTTHSNVALNTLYGRDSVKIYHVKKNNGISTVDMIDSYQGKADILDDCGVKASDLFQSNGIIWVEGPSDRIYIKRWLELFTDNKFKEW